MHMIVLGVCVQEIKEIDLKKNKKIKKLDSSTIYPESGYTSTDHGHAHYYEIELVEHKGKTHSVLNVYSAGEIWPKDSTHFHSIDGYIIGSDINGINDSYIPDGHSHVIPYIPRKNQKPTESPQALIQPLPQRGPDFNIIGSPCSDCGETLSIRGNEICCAPVGIDPTDHHQERDSGGTTDPGDDIIGGCYWVDCSSSDITSSSHMPGDGATSGQARGCFQHQSCGSCNSAGCWWRNDRHDDFTPYGAGFGGTNMNGGCNGAACAGGVFGSCCTTGGDCHWTAESNLAPMFGCPGTSVYDPFMSTYRTIIEPSPNGTTGLGNDGNGSYTYSNVDYFGNCKPCPSYMGLVTDNYPGGVICGDCCNGSPMWDAHSTCTLDGMELSDDECGSGLVYDECGVCGGSGIPAGDCNCFGLEDDCAGQCGGSAVDVESVEVMGLPVHHILILKV